MPAGMPGMMGGPPQGFAPPPGFMPPPPGFVPLLPPVLARVMAHPRSRCRFR